MKWKRDFADPRIFSRICSMSRATNVLTVVPVCLLVDIYTIFPNSEISK